MIKRWLSRAGVGEEVPGRGNAFEAAIDKDPIQPVHGTRYGDLLVAAELKSPGRLGLGKLRESGLVNRTRLVFRALYSEVRSDSLDRTGTTSFGPRREHEPARSIHKRHQASDVRGDGADNVQNRASVLPTDMLDAHTRGYGCTDERPSRADQSVPQTAVRTVTLSYEGAVPEHNLAQKVARGIRNSRPHSVSRP
jgi:hypothetical protein